MWRTPIGDRILNPAEAALFQEALGTLYDMLQDLDDLETGVRVFDDLRRDQKTVLLAGVSKALLFENVPAPSLTAIWEGTVAAVLNHVKWTVFSEIESQTGQPGDYIWRRLVLNAATEAEVEPLPAEKEEAEEEWHYVIEELADRLLWDRDFETGELLWDVPPDEAKAIRDTLRISDGYFSTLPPEPTLGEVEEARGVIERLTAPARRS
jgi:hypothetical protein